MRASLRNHSALWLYLQWCFKNKKTSQKLWSWYIWPLIPAGPYLQDFVWLPCVIVLAQFKLKSAYFQQNFFNMKVFGTLFRSKKGHHWSWEVVWGARFCIVFHYSTACSKWKNAKCVCSMCKLHCARCAWCAECFVQRVQSERERPNCPTMCRLHCVHVCRVFCAAAPDTGAHFLVRQLLL